MPRFVVAGGTIDFPARHVASRAASRAPEAWIGRQWLTVQLQATTPALRVHTGGRSYAGRPASNPTGVWVAIDDVILTAGELRSSRALPGAFTRTSEVLIAPGTVVNIGFASPLFDEAGGGAQAEYVSGPAFRFTALPGKVWHGGAGNA